MIVCLDGLWVNRLDPGANRRGDRSAAGKVGDQALQSDEPNVIWMTDLLSAAWLRMLRYVRFRLDFQFSGSIRLNDPSPVRQITRDGDQQRSGRRYS
jgi:hypothetical protein